jgi:hypothetical protein
MLCNAIAHAYQSISYSSMAIWLPSILLRATKRRQPNKPRRTIKDQNDLSDIFLSELRQAVNNDDHEEVGVLLSQIRPQVRSEIVPLINLGTSPGADDYTALGYAATHSDHQVVAMFLAFGCPLREEFYSMVSSTRPTLDVKYTMARIFCTYRSCITRKVCGRTPLEMSRRLDTQRGKPPSDPSEITKLLMETTIEEEERIRDGGSPIWDEKPMHEILRSFVEVSRKAQGR